MRFSAKEAFDDLTPYQGHLWSIQFLDERANVFNSGGAIGREFPAQNVQEDLFQINYDQLPMANGFVLPLPQYVSYLGNINITFWDKMSEDDVLMVERFFIDWSGEIHTNNTFKDLSKFEGAVKTVVIKRYNSTGTGVIRESRYKCLPPDQIMFNPTGTVDMYTNTVRMVIVGAEKINDK